MNERYSHRERLTAITQGETPDRYAGSIWRHFYHKEATTDGLVEAMLDFQKRYDWDFMKINPRASYHVEDWGNKLDWSTSELANHIKTELAVKSVADWDKIEVLPVTAPVLSEHLRAISLIKKASDPELPLMMTIFNPLGIARNLVGSAGKLLAHLEQEPDQVKTALENITITFENYVREVRDAGADGIFYATLEWASSDLLSYEQYADLCRDRDIRIIRAAGDDALNILHVCASNNYLRELSDYPVPLVNWAAHDPTNVNLDDSFTFLGEKTAIAGLDGRGWLRHSRPGEIAHEIARIKERMTGKRFIFGPGCTVDPRIPPENLDAVRKKL
ncbi:MAG: hypothetical protein JSV44_06230 [Candidatus Zixiibacteriota bacterium]|nr:MAG: hypothetical protein JSV44_06230 [candidate division Zixibacteria bacterium]